MQLICQIELWLFDGTTPRLSCGRSGINLCEPSASTGCMPQITFDRIFSSGVHWALVHQATVDTLCNLA
jgi:hypothetical protein